MMRKDESTIIVRYKCASCANEHVQTFPVQSFNRWDIENIWNDLLRDESTGQISIIWGHA